MLPRSTTAVLGSAGLLLLATPAQAAFVRRPWIQDATSSTVTVAWQAGSAGGTQRLEYGIGGTFDHAVDAQAISGALYRATVNGLAPSQGFQYRVISGGDTSPVGSFVTAPAQPEPFRFAVTGDNRSDSSGHAAVVASIVPFAPDFFLNTGDIVDGTDYTQFFAVEAELLKNAPIFPAPGNHDSPSQYQFGFARPNYYSFRWGNAFFLAIDTNSSHGSGSSQYQWIQSELAEASADPAVEWIFAYHHHPAYSSGMHGNTGSVLTHLNPLYKQYGVDVVFAGHDHNYERIERDGIVYLVTGGGGVSPRSMESPVEGQVIAESVRHAVIADLDGGVLDLRAYRPDGSLIDERRIQKGPPSGSGGGGSGGGRGPWEVTAVGPADPAARDGGGGGSCDVGRLRGGIAPAAVAALGALAFGLAVTRRRSSR